MNKEKLYKLAHLLSGFVVMLHGVGQLDEHHGSPWFFFISGALMLLVAIFHHRVEKLLGSGEGIIFFLEGAVQCFIAIHYFELGKKALPFAHLFSSLLYCYVGYLKFTGKKPFWKTKK